MTEAEARAALAAFDGLGGLERPCPQCVRTPPARTDHHRWRTSDGVMAEGVVERGRGMASGG